MDSKTQQVGQLEKIAAGAFALIAETFPVCAVSDEFYFFPQVVPEVPDWKSWDDFSAMRVSAVAERLIALEQDLLSLSAPGMQFDDAMDAHLLQRALCTLREQLVDICPQSTQPTFHLTVLASGLAEALVADDKGAWPARIAGAPVFLHRAVDCLTGVPELFLTLGLDMLGDVYGWLCQLQADGICVGALPRALLDFRSALHKLKAVENYRYPEELLEKMVVEHLGCALGSDAAWALLQEEVQAMEALLSEEASRLAPGCSWIEAREDTPFIAASGGNLLEQHLRELVAMEAHCRTHGLVPGNLPGSAVLEVAAIPEYLSVIRASDAYSAFPGAPPRGGVFFVMEHGHSQAGCAGRTLEYRMTAAHEGWPGHHLLDACRWNLDRPLRRPLESPLFYEGWACLAEELMAHTGYLDNPWDRFLLAKRRIERATRGLVDLGLQCGRMTEGAAVQLLMRVGYRPETARSIIPKYLLRPGYQLCYTLGLRQGLDLFDRFGRDTVGEFSQSILRQGEIGFDRLTNILAARHNP